METVTIGLDIGASAVRAAEVRTSGKRPALQRVGQVGLPPGAVSDGEIMQVETVAAAIRRLWASAGFTSRQVVLGASGSRIIVRQADVPALSHEELRSALRFDSQELIPIPMDQAAFDFRVLGHDGGTDIQGRKTSRILMVAGQRELLDGHLRAAEAAGLEVTAIDATALALLRLLPAGGGGEEARAVVSIGSDATTIAVEDGGVPRFVRSLGVGGAHLSAGLAKTLHIDPDVAERLRREPDPSGERAVKLRQATRTELQQLAEEVRGTVDFFAGQSSMAPITRVLVTGGGALGAGVADAVRAALAVPVEVLSPYEGLTVGDVGLAPGRLEQLAPRIAGALGLALWGASDPAARLSMLPEDVVAARRVRRVQKLAVAAGAGVVAALAGAAAFQFVQVRSADQQTAAARAQVAGLTRQVGTLQAATVVRTQVADHRRVVVADLAGDVDWVAMLQGLGSVLPPNLSLTAFSGGRSVGAQSAAGAAGSSAAASSSNLVTFSVQGTGGLPAVSAWLQALARDPDFSGAWVSAITVTPQGALSFTSNATLTRAALSARAKQVPK